MVLSVAEIEEVGEGLGLAEREKGQEVCYPVKKPLPHPQLGWWSGLHREMSLERPGTTEEKHSHT